MPAIEPGQKAVVAETKSAERQGPPQFIPKLKGKKVIIRLTSGGQPVTGTIKNYNPYASDGKRANPGLQTCHRHD